MTTPNPRRFLSVLEPIVTSVYFSAEPFEEYVKLGLVDGWAAYFCSRSAAMGAVSGETVAATFYNFNPDLVIRSVDWSIAAPDDVYAARLRGVGRALERLLAEDGAMPDLARALELIKPLVAACPPQGRPIAAPHAAKPWPEDPLIALWYAANILREFRGDGHVAVLVAQGIGPADALHLQCGYIGLKDRARAAFFATRDWDEETLRRGEENLRERGFLDADGLLTDAGGKFRGMIEHDTDRAAMAPFEAVSIEHADELSGILEPLAVRILERRGVPSPLGRMDPAHPLRG
ncbi:MAG: SCO6745 family protein [Actinomycetota bacterium]